MAQGHPEFPAYLPVNPWRALDHTVDTRQVSYTEAFTLLGVSPEDLEVPEETTIILSPEECYAVGVKLARLTLEHRNDQTPFTLTFTEVAAMLRLQQVFGPQPSAGEERIAS